MHQQSIEVILDTCSIIILTNGGVLDVVLALNSHKFYVGAIVRRECGELHELLTERVADGSMFDAANVEISATRFGELLGQYDLGLGETECLAVAEVTGFLVCSDDFKARQMAGKHLGDNRVIGTLYLLRECVRQGRLSTEQARQSYELMKIKGAFLPDVPEGYF